MSSNISIYNEDSLQALRAMQDKQFDLAIVVVLGVLFIMYLKHHFDNLKDS